MTPWLRIIGIGEDGVEGLSPAARHLIEAATLVVGGARHLALAAPVIRGERLAWPSPMAQGIPAILARRGEAVVVLASGDPHFYGVGATLLRHVPVEETLTLPAPSSVALACARLGWPQASVTTVSLCGRPLEPLFPLLQPGSRLIALSADASTPGLVAAALRARGFGPSILHVLEALGGPAERRNRTTAADFVEDDIAPLNLLAIEVVAGPGALVIPLGTGLDDAFFEHDGQITKREIRAVTLSSLGPRAGELLWDIGCGSGSVAIEWLLRHKSMRAVGIEANGERSARAARNAARLGVPHLELVNATAPDGLAGLPVPDAVFIGGGITGDGVVDAAWARLRSGGRLVANSVTVESDAVLIAACARLGGTLTRIGIERLDTIGRLHGFRPAMTVTQWSVVKP
jgi:precorrin-6Y C5,15-methyltransferase (decarboxylating)